ncbi:MAG: type II secretion system F family protein [bacterium]
MPTYRYKARDQAGKVVSGVMDASNADALAMRMRQLNYVVTSITETKKSQVPFADTLERLQRIKPDDIVMYVLQLASMIGAGISLPAALQVLAAQVENNKLKVITNTILDDIKAGKTFSEALHRHPEVFSNIFVNMVRAGEVTGNLEEVLRRLASFVEKEADIKAKINGAVAYPKFLTGLGIIVVTYVTGFVLPSFVEIFKSSNVPLPGPTLFLYTIGMFIKSYWLYILISIAAVFFGLSRYGRTPQGKYVFDGLKLKYPIFGALNRKVTIARFARTLATLTSSGVPLLQCLEIVESTIDNAVLAKVMVDVRSSVSRGESMSAPLRESGEFPPMPVQMIAIGEESGALDTMLNKIADFYETSADYTIKKLAALLEPIFLVVIGGLVGLIFASILMPIFGMVKTLKH